MIPLPVKEEINVKFFLWFDGLVLELVEAFSHRLQLWTGKTNFFLAKLMAVIFCIATLVDIVEQITTHTSFKYQLPIDSLVVIIAFSSIVWLYGSQEYQAVRRLTDGVANPLKINPIVRTLRILAIGLQLIDVLYHLIFLCMALLLYGTVKVLRVDWNKEIESWTITFWYYLISCDPLPPCSGKISYGLKRFFGQTSKAKATR